LPLLHVKLCQTFVSVLAELEQKTALLPAVLQTSNCIALVDHLTSVFKETDWSSAARQAQAQHFIRIVVSGSITTPI